MSCCVVSPTFLYAVTTIYQKVWFLFGGSVPVSYLRHMKALVMIRVSTETQKLEDQHREMEVFCNGEGYDDLVFVEDKGASAIKLNDSYRMMIEQVKDEIEKDPDITCFAVWELSRAFRNELVFQEVKMFLVERRIQFLVKNPYLKLLNPDGTVNSGMDIAVTLMATLARQEMELKKERFKRAKRSMLEQGKYIGGHTLKFGYRVADDGYIVIDEEDSKLVRLIFEMYATGQWSVRKLWDELTERGYSISLPLINKIVADRSYVEGRYPRMISQELWDRCESVRKRNFLSIPKGRKYCFGSGIIKCPVCGNGMIADGDQYTCRHHKKYSAPPHCTNDLTARIENMDGLLWFVAAQEETKYRMRMYREGSDSIEKEVAVLREKLSAAEKKMEGMEEKKSRIMELYMEGHLKKEEKDKKLLQWTESSKMTENTILSLKEKIEGVLGALRSSEEELPDLDRLKGIYEGVIGEEDLKEMDRIVKRQIERVTSERIEFHGRKSSQMITIETMYSGVRRFIYVARKWKGHYFFNEKGEALASIRKIVRESAGIGDPRAFKKIKDW